MYRYSLCWDYCPDNTKQTSDFLDEQIVVILTSDSNVVESMANESCYNFLLY